MSIYLVLLQIITIHFNFGLKCIFMHTCKYVCLLAIMKSASHEFITTKMSRVYPMGLTYGILFIFLCSPVCLQAFIQVYTCACGGQSLMSSIICDHSSTCSLGQALSVEPRNPDLTDTSHLVNQLPGDQLPLPSEVGITVGLQVLGI